jgi:hypothetical protein
MDACPLVSPYKLSYLPDVLVSPIWRMHDSSWGRALRLNFPVDQKIKSRFTANGVLKQAGLPKYF